MICELKGGPKDGDVIDVDPNFIWGDHELYIPDQSTDPMLIATYRWLFGAADHLDFSGYAKT
jgi:hypothetical protein